MCEFLTAVQHKLPVKVVIYNNSAFGLIRLEAEAIGVPAYIHRPLSFPIRISLHSRARLRWLRLRGAQARRAEESDR